MSITIGEMEDQFNTLQTLSDSQFRTIAQLKKELTVLKEENQALKIASPSCSSVNLEGISNPQLICETQITILKDRAITRELTLEEAKKAQIFIDILNDIKKNTPNASKITVEKMSTEELLQLVEVGNNVIVN